MGAPRIIVKLELSISLADTIKLWLLPSWCRDYILKSLPSVVPDDEPDIQFDADGLMKALTQGKGIRGTKDV